MKISKALKTRSDVDVGYHHIPCINRIDFDQKTLIVKINSYVSKNAFDSGKEPVSTTVYKTKLTDTQVSQMQTLVNKLINNNQTDWFENVS